VPLFLVIGKYNSIIQGQDTIYNFYKSYRVLAEYNITNNTNFNSEYIKHIIDKESLDLVNNAYNEAQTILNANKEQLLFLSELLQNNTVIYKHDLHNFIHDSSC
jgi:ATP-dependent Zn protease